MSDRPDRSHDVPNEQIASPPAVNVAPPTRSEPAFHNEQQRVARDFERLTDDFGRRMFDTPQLSLAHANEPIGLMSSAKAGAPETADDFRVHRIEMAGQRRGATDLAALAMLQSISMLTSAQSVAELCHNVSVIGAIGMQRADRLGNALERRGGESSQESYIKDQIAAEAEKKLAGAPMQLQQAKEREKLDRKKDERDGKPRESDPLSSFTQLFQRQMRQHGDKISRDFSDWMGARQLGNGLGKKETAENSMQDLIHKARDGNAAARDYLAATLVSGNAQDSWLIAKRNDFDGVARRPVSAPNLAPELRHVLKDQAAEGLISLADVKDGLTRSEYMALAIAMGEAFQNKVQNQSSDANDSLLRRTANHFVKTMLTNPLESKDQQLKQRQENNLRNAMGGLVDAVEAKVPGAEHIAKFIDHVILSEEATVKVSPLRQNYGKVTAGRFGRRRAEVSIG